MLGTENANGLARTMGYFVVGANISSITDMNGTNENTLYQNYVAKHEDDY